MKKSLILSLSLALLFSSCGSNKKKAEASIRKYISDNAFREGKKVDIQELDVISVEPCDSGYYISQKILKLYDMKSEMEVELMKEVEFMNEKKRNMEMYTAIGNHALANAEKEEGLAKYGALKQHQLNVDQFALMIDSLAKIEVDSTQKYFYNARVFLKAAAEGANVLDTLVYVMDRNWNIVNLNKKTIYQ